MKFYRLAAQNDEKYFHGEWDPYPPDLHGIYLGDERPDNLRIRVSGGRMPGDMVFGAPNVVSPRFAQLLAGLHCTGYSTFAVPIVGGACALPEYHCLVVHGRGGDFDPQRSDADIRETGTVFGHSAVYMHEEDWDGSDLFFIPGLGISLFVTERVAEVVMAARCENVELILNSEFRTGTRIPPMRPGDLSTNS